MGSGNWIVDNLNSALGTRNGKLAEIWTLLSISPEEFKGGGVWSVIVGINGGLKAIGYALTAVIVAVYFSLRNTIGSGRPAGSASWRRFPSPWAALPPYGCRRIPLAGARRASSSPSPCRTPFPSAASGRLPGGAQFYAHG